jgi:hypothetical protein
MWGSPGTVVISLTYALAFVIALLSLLKRSRYSGVSVVFGLLLIASVVACGGGSSGNGSNGGNGGTGTVVGGTPTGNYQGVTVMVTINGYTQTINNLSVNVQ